MKDLLQVAARSGSGSAARALGSGLAGMRTATRRLLITCAIAAFLVYLGWDFLSGVTADPRITTETEPAAGSVTTDVSIGVTPPASSPATGTASIPQSGRVTYAMKLNEVSGLSPSAPPGTMLDLWVTWDRPLTEVPKLQRLVRRVVLEQIAPPVTPNGPYVAMLSVSQSQADELVWADRYGSLGATMLPSRP